MIPKVCIYQTDGTNCDRETAFAFQRVGADPTFVHINTIRKGYDPVSQKSFNLHDYHILVLCGGFSAGDYISAGKVMALELESIREDIDKFIADDKLVIGICNGFQALVKSGILPDLDWQQKVTLTYNDSARFECRHARLTSYDNKCVWAKGINDITLPIAHGEGKFVAPNDLCDKLFENGQVVFQYADSNGNPTMKFPVNPNGSKLSIAGICDKSGRVFGLMPHPERYNDPHNHRFASLQKVLSRDYIDKDDPVVKERLKQIGTFPKEGLGLQIFRNGIEYILENFKEVDKDVQG